MAQLVRNVMTRDPVCVTADTPVTIAAKRMRDHDIGDVLVMSGDELRGIVTDRDIVVRGLATGVDMDLARVGDLATPQPACVSPQDPAEMAVRIMRELSVRRLPVCDADGTPVGVVSLGDLAVEHDPHSALAEISESTPNV
ncbi:CBS domain-containing protein [Phytomonospora endophytica]|uniref:CBS domain-containing protein n=1 Tax=Phytomonospora endophytica TaxID=714109 RepID=A0A841FZ99_9ACTN|nr:CBS domain-containing protein [Phytomonospora endophytica]MBB6037270.1 CBS domain-containing protein [Phytomonospora endophytica]GIG69986.1 oxidoreductase [Phytomonospora endophytica]